ncbi:hypothetical protein V1281_003254 [Nitrobacteraceae bacterium AZCC 2161]
MLKAAAGMSYSLIQAPAMQAQIHRIENKPYQPELLLQPEDVASVIMNALTCRAPLR